MKTIFVTAVASVMLSATAFAQCAAMGKSMQYTADYPEPAAAVASAPEVKASAGPVASDDDGPNPAITGLWLTKFVSGGQVVDQGFDIWSSDGTEILNDTPPPATGNVCLGVWSKVGNTYKLKHPSWTFDNNGNLSGTAVIKEQVSVSANGNSFSGTFTIDEYDLSGHNIFHAAGTVTAQRITTN